MSDYSLDFSIAHDQDQGGHTINFRCFDTPNAVTVFGVADYRQAENLLLEVRAQCLELHRLWSFSLPESDVSNMNGNKTRIVVDAQTAHLLNAMIEFNKAEPLFDFTIGPVSYLWKHATSLPEPAELQEALSHVGARKVKCSVLSPNDATYPVPRRPCALVEKADAGVRIDVGGAAKGYAADQIANYLQLCGVTSADVDLGGNLYMVGNHPSGRAWRVGVRVPEGIPALKCLLEVSGKSVVTSGSYERFVTIGSKRYQHIINPISGYPCEGDVVSATVVAKSSLEADMLATTMLIVGSSGLQALSSRHPCCELVAITSAGEVLRYNGGHGFSS